MVRLSIVRRVSALVSSSWLHKAVAANSPGVRVLEASWPDTREQYQSGHIPGARYYDLSHCVSSVQHRPRGVPTGETALQCWTDYMQELGLDDDNHVVMYDRGSMLMSARAWWTFRMFGHYKVSVLDGGWKMWESEDLPVEQGEVAPPAERGTFRVHKVNASLIRSYEDMLVMSQDTGGQIVDARAWNNYTGEGEEPAGPTKASLSGASLPVPESMQRGHVPGAVHLLEEKVLNKDTNCVLPENELREVFRESGVDLRLPMTTMCYNGFAACLVALAAATLEKKDVAVYPGSWTEFGQRAQDNNVVKGPGPRSDSDFSQF